MNDTSLPYPDRRAGRSSGWTGSDTSRERAEHADATGTTGARQADAERRLGRARYHGMTWRELAEATGMHHGQASGVLSNLHHDGRVLRLTLTRERCGVYVLPEFIAGRQTADYGRTKANQPDPAGERMKRALRAVLVEHGDTHQTVEYHSGAADYTTRCRCCQQEHPCASRRLALEGLGGEEA